MLGPSINHIYYCPSTVTATKPKSARLWAVTPLQVYKKRLQHGSPLVNTGFAAALGGAPRGVRMSPCILDLVLARHNENISWAHGLRASHVCLHVYRTGLAVEFDEIPVPNTGREALCFILHIQRVLSGRVSIS